jgi:hypothetical protein
MPLTSEDQSKPRTGSNQRTARYFHPMLPDCYGFPTSLPSIVAPAIPPNPSDKTDYSDFSTSEKN